MELAASEAKVVGALTCLVTAVSPPSSVLPAFD